VHGLSGQALWRRSFGEGRIDGSPAGVLWRGSLQVVLCWAPGSVTSRGSTGGGLLGSFRWMVSPVGGPEGAVPWRGALERSNEEGTLKGYSGGSTLE
jgi:hypothetical protein